MAGLYETNKNKCRRLNYDPQVYIVCRFHVIVRINSLNVSIFFKKARGTFCNKKKTVEITFKSINHSFYLIWWYRYQLEIISYQFFCTGIWHCRRHLKIQYVIAIHVMRWLTNFYDFRFKWTATAAIGIHPAKAWLSQQVNFKIQSGL